MLIFLIILSARSFSFFPFLSLSPRRGETGGKSYADESPLRLPVLLSSVYLPPPLSVVIFPFPFSFPFPPVGGKSGPLWVFLPGEEKVGPLSPLRGEKVTYRGKRTKWAPEGVNYGGKKEGK